VYKYVYATVCADGEGGGGGGLQGADLCVKPTDRSTERPALPAARCSFADSRRERERGGRGSWRLRKGPLNRRSLPLHRILISAATSRSSVRLSTDMKKKKKKKKKKKRGKKKERNSSPPPGAASSAPPAPPPRAFAPLFPLFL